ncbi:MAG: biotin synthase BioB [Corynebacterium sp.]|uniref:biotin synthase BioB n=1 Tax=unclassified Corynebacterium TaxID=2624378 RepID=UPI00264926C7|nr:biotin synthase BioB [Corynebacterium sp.]MDN5582711.1 biotin synthase BioB [Corynebacterium sp.]MDN5720970.1 biotin synthase BioB [Corynebacterium sp.]
MDNILTTARTRVLDDGRGLDYDDLIRILQLPDESIPDLLALAHEVRVKWCGEEVEMEGIVSLKTGGCPEDCHFCSQSGLFDSPVRSTRLDIAELIEQARQTAKTGATEFCIVAAVRGPDENLMSQLEVAVEEIYANVDGIDVSVSVGMLTQKDVDRLKAVGVHRYNHNLETARSYFPKVVTTHTWEERRATMDLIKDAGIEVCCGGIVGMGESMEQRAEFAVQLAELDPDEVPLNFLDPRPGTPFADMPVMDGKDALRAVGMFRLAMPATTLRFAGGRELTLGDLGVEQGLTGGINGVIVGNYLTTLGRPAEEDMDMVGRMNLPIKVLSRSV